MLDATEGELLTDDFRILNAASPRSSPQGSTMVPRRLMLFVKIAVVFIAITLILIIVTALTKRNSMFDIVNFQSAPESADETMQDGLRIGNMYFDQFTQSMIFRQPNRGEPYATFVLKSKHNLKSSKIKHNSDCVNNGVGEDKHVLCLEFDDFNLAVYERKNLSMDCHTVHLRLRSQDVKEGHKTIVDQCVDMNENWYGGGALSEQRWPLNRVNVSMQPYITKKFNRDSSKNVHFESFLEPYFVSASGTAIVLDPYLPLFVSINKGNDKKICFKSAFDYPYQFEKGAVNHTLLRFTICKDRLARDVHLKLIKNKILNRPLSVPNMDILQKPVWSTRGLDVRNINEAVTLTYIGNLKRSNLNFSQLFIDANYSRSPGSIYFDEKRFPHSAQLAMELDSKLPHENLKLATEVFPYLPPTMISESFSYSASKGHVNEDISERTLLDVLNEKAVEWFALQLNTLVSQVKVKGFRFSGGQAASVLDRYGTFITNQNTNVALHPNQVTHEYSKIAAKFQSNSFLGSGYKSQSPGLVADAGPFSASWIHRKGFKSVIPTVILYGIMGYPFVSAGPIGGIDLNLNSSSGHFSLSSRNLFLRWVQLATFLPVMEFSVGPWQYDDAVVDTTRNLIRYRQNEIWPKYLLPALQETSKFGIPVIRPLWWVAPQDKTAQFIDCEFMVGDSLLVAPVLEQGQVARQVYLPFGWAWQDVLRGGRVHQGGKWLRDYHVGEFEIAHFVRVATAKSSPLSSTVFT